MQTVSKRLKYNFCLTAIGSVIVFFNIAAATTPGTDNTNGHSFPAVWLWHCFLFGLLGVVMVVVGFKVFDWLLRRIDIEGEVAKGNVAAAILGASVVLGISIIIASAIH